MANALTTAGERILATIGAKGWTQAEFAIRMGWSGEQWRVYRLLRADSVDIGTALKVARVLNLPMSMWEDERGTR